MNEVEVTMPTTLSGARSRRLRTLLTVMITTAALLIGLPISPAHAQDPDLDWYGPYMFWTQNQYVLAVAEAGGSGSRAVQWDDLGSPEQFWWIEDAPNGGGFLHPKSDTSLCLDRTVEANEGLGVKTCNGSDAQNFTVAEGTSHYAIKPTSDASKCTDNGTQNLGDVPALRPCNNTPVQWFDYAPDV